MSALLPAAVMVVFAGFTLATRRGWGRERWAGWPWAAPMVLEVVPAFALFGMIATLATLQPDPPRWLAWVGAVIAVGAIVLLLLGILRFLPRWVQPAWFRDEYADRGWHAAARGRSRGAGR